MKHDDDTKRPCETESCLRPASEGDAFCETCALERSLFQRETRDLDPISRPASASSGLARPDLRG